jgi:hypothetical protein
MEPWITPLVVFYMFEIPSLICTNRVGPERYLMNNYKSVSAVPVSVCTGQDKEFGFLLFLAFVTSVEN